MKKLSFILLCILSISCTKETTKIESTKSDRLIFKDFDEYKKTTLELSKISTLSDLELWAKSKGHSTLLHDSDTTLNDFPPATRTLLNKDSEFQLGDSIVWFYAGNGNLYTFAKNANYIDDLKKNPESYKSSGYLRTRVATSVGSKGYIVNLNTSHAEFQDQLPIFNGYTPCGETTVVGAGGIRKFVEEIRDVTTYYSYGMYYISTLYLGVKCEWKVSSWKESQTEQKNVSYYLNGTISYKFDYGSREMPPIAISGNHSCANGTQVMGNIWRFLGQGEFDGFWGIPYWEVNLTGNATQQILGPDNPIISRDIFWY